MPRFNFFILRSTLRSVIETPQICLAHFSLLAVNWTYSYSLLTLVMLPRVHASAIRRLAYGFCISHSLKLGVSQVCINICRVSLHSNQQQRWPLLCSSRVLFPSRAPRWQLIISQATNSSRLVPFKPRSLDTMLFTTITVAVLLGLADATPIEIRQTRTTSKEFSLGGCRDILLAWARGSTEIGNMVIILSNSTLAFCQQSREPLSGPQLRMG